MLNWMQACPTGVRWRTARNHQIEVEGEGITMPPTAAQWMLVATWQNFGPELARAAKYFGIPVSWLLALATVETGGFAQDPVAQATARSPTGAAGLMQFTRAAAADVGLAPEDRDDPAKATMAAAQLLYNKIHGIRAPRAPLAELPVLASAYNEGSGSNGVRCTPTTYWGMAENAGSGYVDKVVRYNNLAVSLGVNDSFSAVELIIIGAGALSLGWYGWRNYDQIKPKIRKFLNRVT